MDQQLLQVVVPIVEKHSYLEHLCDEELSHILSYCDFISAVRFCKCTSKILRQRFLIEGDNNNNNNYDDNNNNNNGSNNNNEYLWKEFFDRHLFSGENIPQKEMMMTRTNCCSNYNHHRMSYSSSGSIYGKNYNSNVNNKDYITLTWERRKLVRNLVGHRPSRCDPRGSLEVRMKTAGEKTLPRTGAIVDNSKKRVLRCCFNLPNRFFHFIPITDNAYNDNYDDDDDDDDEDEMFWRDPPPVDFDCDCFALTSTSVGGELLLLDPFHGGLVIYENCMDNAIASDEAMMEQAMLQAAASVVASKEDSDWHPQDSHWKGGQFTDMNDSDSMHHRLEDEAHIAGTVFDQNVYRNHHIVDQYKTPPSQILIPRAHHQEDEGEEALLQLMEYFPAVNHNDAGTANNITYRVEIGYHGLDVKPIIYNPNRQHPQPHVKNHDNNYQQQQRETGNKNTIIGNLVAIGRIFEIENQRWGDNMDQQQQVCTEILAWTRMHPNVQYQSKMVCRFQWTFQIIDICAQSKRCFVCFAHGDGPIAHAMTPGTETTTITTTTPTIVVYPLVPVVETRKGNETETTRKKASYFPKPEFLLHCQHPISTFAIDNTGDTFLVGTTVGTIELWDLRGAPVRHATVDVKSSIARVIQQQQQQTQPYMLRTSCQGTQYAPSYDSGDSSLGGNESLHYQHQEYNTFVDTTFPCLGETIVVTSFHLPSHLPVSSCGFVTLQQNRSDGATTLLLWRNKQQNKENHMCHELNFQVVSIINLPLSASRTPRVFFDGRRLIVFGQDHIGFIVLVYLVTSTMEDLDLLPAELDTQQEPYQKQQKKQKQPGREVEQQQHIHHQSRQEQPEEASGGVYNLTFPPMLHFANRIRHAALGGLEYYDSIHMTCNERFVVVNTKTGNLLSGGSFPYAEGLLVIDLEDHK